MTTAAPPTSEQPPATPEWRTDFLDILQNRGKNAVDPGVKGGRILAGSVRERGFVVGVSNTIDLQPLQELCLGPDQTWNDCVVFRYRIAGSPVFGTAIAALLADVQTLRESPPTPPPVTRGIVAWRPAGSRWPDTFRGGYLKDVSGFTGAPEGTTGALDPSWTTDFLVALGDPQLVGTGRRLVLMLELETPLDPGEAEAASGLLADLPERVGVVVSNTQPDVLPQAYSLVLPATEGGTAYRRGALRSDRPSRDDRLDVRPYADALASFVLLPQTSPLTIAVHGPWGKGKSSFMQMVEETLVVSPSVEEVDELAEADGKLAAARDAEPAPSPDEVRRLEQQRERTWQRIRRVAFDDVVTVRFNAWRYEDSTQIWAGLASTITRELEHALPPARRLATPFRYAWSRHRRELLLDFGVPLAAVVLAAIVVLLAGWNDFTSFLTRLGEGNVALQKALPLGAGVALGFWALVRSFRRALQPVSERVLTYVRRPDYRDRMGYQHVVLEDVRFVSDRLRKARPSTRVVVFIDDLDRCSPEKIMEILQAINLILGESDFFVVLGIDTAMIRRAIEARYREDIAAGSLPSDFATTYLRKIVQLDFHLPPSAPGQRAAFLGALFSRSARDEAAGVVQGDAGAAPVGGLRWSLDRLVPPRTTATTFVEDTPDELKAFLELEEFVADNPRELKRLVNVHRFVKIVLSPDGVAVEKTQQRKLVKWLVFCSRWPDLVDDVLAHAQGSETEDCISACLATIKPSLGETAQELDTFVAIGEKLTSEDLRREDWLVRAAHLSEFVRFEPVAPEPAPAEPAEAPVAAEPGPAG
jgi:hypothetical protein